MIEAFDPVAIILLGRLAGRPERKVSQMLVRRKSSESPPQGPVVKKQSVAPENIIN